MNLVSDDEKIRIGCYKCVVCQSTNRYVNDDIGFLQLLVDAGDGFSEMQLPCITSVCKDCGFIMQFSPARFE